VKTKNKDGELRDDIGAIDSLFYRKPRSSPPRSRTVEPGDAFEDAAFKPGFEIVKF
jgi:hypothetical protein